MENLIYDLAKYAMSLFMMIYVLESFFALSGDGKKGNIRQYIYIMAVHVCGFAALYLKKGDLFFLLFCAAQQITLLIFRILYKVIYPALNRMILNHMCMFICVGMVMISRLSTAKAVRQFAIIALSMAIGTVVPFLMRIFKNLRRLTWVYAITGGAALLMVLCLGAVTNGSKISYSLFGFTFQPSEFVKILFIFFLAAYLSRGAGVKRILISAGISLLYVLTLVASTDLGTALIFFVIYAFLVYLASGKTRYIAAFALLGAGGSYAAYRFFGHIKVRVAAWLDPWKDITGKGYQMAQSLFAIGTGGWLGFGLCQGTPETIPYVEADFIFSAISEELGVLFGICLILLCLCCFLSFMSVGGKSQDGFYRLIGYGIAISYAFQVFLTIGGGIKLIPHTGVTLPLVSYGGSSVMVTILMFSVIQGICVRSSYEVNVQEAAQTEETKEDAPADPASDTKKHAGAENADDAASAASADTDKADAKSAATDIEIIDLDEAKSAKEETVPAFPLPIRRRQIIFMSAVFSVLFILMSGYILYFMREKRHDVVTNPYNAGRQEALARINVRGTIKAANGEVLAYTKLDETTGKEVRRYPYETLFAHVVGYPTNGGMGIEKYMNYYLITNHQSIGEELLSDLNNKKKRADTVFTTLDPQLQEIAYRILGEEKGAVVVMEPSTGKILAMVSKPDFNPNEIDAIWSGLMKDKKSTVLLNRATQGLYPPGSTFKIYTALEYIREHPADYNQYYFSCGGRYRAGDGSTIYCYAHDAHGGVNFEQSFAHSCNSSFANIGMRLDRDMFADTLTQLYFGKKIPGDLNIAMGRINMGSNISDYDMVQTAIGQGTTLITPIQLCMMTCAIANGGDMMMPYLVTRVETSEGTLVKKYEPQSCGRVMSEEEAEILTRMMKAVCKYGTGYRLNGETYQAAGKTGSAEFDDYSDDSHAWFTGFAPADDPKIAVTIIIEKVGSGSSYAVPIAQRLFQTYFEEIAQRSET